MRIAYVIPTFWPYVRRGAERFTYELASYMARRGHVTEVITAKPGSARIGWYGKTRVIYGRQERHPLTAKYGGGYLYLYLFGLTALPALMATRYDIVHCWFYSCAPTVYLATNRNGGSYIYHDMMPQMHYPHQLDRCLFQWAIRRATAVAVLSRPAADRLARNYGIQAEVIPPPVNMDEFKPVANTDLDCPRVLFTSSMSDRRKGLELLLHSFKYLRHRCPRAVLQLAGPQEWTGLSDDMRALLASPELQDSVEFIGAGTLVSLPKLYAKAAVTVMPAVQEPFGMVLVESLASGTPVVGTTPGGPAEIITPEVGTLVALNNQEEMSSEAKAQELAEAILSAIELAKDPATSERCRLRAKQWGVETIGERTEALYREVLA